MEGIWIWKCDGTLQCNQGVEIPIRDHLDELSKIIGPDNIISSEKRAVPLIIPTVCGAPTGSANCIKLTFEGAYILFRGIVGPLGWKLWIWSDVQGPTARGGEGDTFPVAMLEQTGEGQRGMLLNFLAAANSAGSQPQLITDLIGRRLRYYKTGDVLTMDYIPERANIEVNEGNIIQSVWFG